MKPSQFKLDIDELLKLDSNEIRLTNFLLEKGFISNLTIVEDKVKAIYLPVICEKNVGLWNSSTFNKFLRDGSGQVVFSMNIPEHLVNSTCINKKCEFKTCPVVIGICSMLDNANKNHKLIEGEVDVIKQLDKKETYVKRKELVIKNIYKSIIGQSHIKEKLQCYLDKLGYISEDKRVFKVPKIFVFKGDNHHAKKAAAFALAKILYFHNLVEDDSLAPCDALFFTDKNSFSTKYLTYVKNLDELGSAVKKQSDLYACIIKELFRIKNKNMFVVIDMTDKLYLNLVEGDGNIKSSIDEVFKFDDYTEEEILQLFNEELLKNKLSHSNEFDDYMNQYIKRYMKYNDVKNMNIVNKLMAEIFNTISKNKINIENEITIGCLPDLQDKELNENINNSFESKLGSLVGLASVKKEVNKLVSYLQFLKKISNKIPIPVLNLHSVFDGNPGTGKSTVARIYGEILYTLGYIKENKIIEVSRQDLVAEYIGQTAIKTQSVINKAMGGVLFIDEAYTLNPTSSNDFAHECIATLIEAMEDKRNDLVVIFAGYTKSMKEFINANDGLASRINSIITFEDYSEDELYTIFKSSITDMGFLLYPDVEKRVREIIRNAMKCDNFGNGRYIMKLKQAILMQHSINTKEIQNEEELLTIKGKDIVEPEILNTKASNGNLIGFVH